MTLCSASPHTDGATLASVAHRPYIPTLEQLRPYWEQIEQAGWLTNHGPMVQSLEKRLADWLGVPHVVTVANGTLALQIACKVLGLKGEVITTPLSFVATPNALSWEGMTPRFADVDPDTLTLDPRAVQQAITCRTSGIMPVHVFGHACHTEALKQVAQAHGLPLIYDAAQAFGLHHQGQSILCQDTISVLSFHATKIFHTVEGGALIIHDPNHLDKALHYRNHGRIGFDNTAPRLGINAKMSEMHAAMGHCSLDTLAQRIAHHQRQRQRYVQRLQKHLAAGARLFHDDKGTQQTCSLYLPLLWPSAAHCQAVEQTLAHQGLKLRRYFDPPLHQLPHFGHADACPIAEDLAQRLSCLPLPPAGSLAFIDRVCDIMDTHTRWHW